MYAWMYTLVHEASIVKLYVMFLHIHVHLVDITVALLHVCYVKIHHKDMSMTIYMHANGQIIKNIFYQLI
jgi:hypothetical protein